MRCGNVWDFSFSNFTDCNIDLISAAGDVIYTYTTFLILVYSVLAEKNGCHGSTVKLKRMLAPNLRWCLLLLLLVMCVAELAESILDNARYWCPSLRVLTLVSIAVLTEYTERRANGMYVLWIAVYWIYSAVVRSVQLWVFPKPCLESARYTFTAISLCITCVFLALDLCVLIKALHEKLSLSKASCEPEECQVNSHASKVSSQPGLAVTLGQSSDDVFISSSQNDMSAGLSHVPNPSSNGSGSPLITANQPAYQHANANFLSRAVFAWIVPTLIKGYKVPLELENLGKLPDVERSHTQSQRLQELLDRQKMNRQSPSLWWCYWEFTRTFLLWGGVLKLLGDVAACFGPLMIKQIVEYAEKNSTVNSDSPEYAEKYSTVNGNSSCLPTEDSITLSIFFANGYILAVCVLLSAFLQGSLSQSSTHLLCMGGIRLRLGLQSVLYHKSLKLASWAIPAKSEENAPGQTSAMDAGGLSNLMEEDTFNAMMLIWVGHYIWAIPLKIAALLVMLYGQLGQSSLIGAFVGIVVMFPLQCVLGKKMAANSNNIMVLSDERLRKVHEMLQGLRVLKIHAWEEVFKKHVQDTRSKELTLLNWDSTYWALMTFSTQASSVLITLVTFGVYNYMEEPLSAGSAFTALALFNQLTVPLFLIPVTLPVFISARTSTRRLAEFFARPEMVCPLNTQASPSETLERMPPSNSCLENIVEADEDESSAVAYPPVSPHVLEVSQASFTWDGDFKLNNITLSIPKGKLVMIVGSMGSGKSSLLAAMLGEMKKLNGDVKWSSTGPVGFVMQKPWLLNGSIKDNILFGQVHKEKRYKKVLRACQLLEDLESLPHGEHTEVGDRGLALSGGQKSRIALARALYSRAKILFLDDPLSALDAQVGERVFSDAIEKIALNSKRTVLLVTHNVRFMQRAHEVIVMDKGQILKQGPPSSITLDFNDVSSNDSPLSRTARDRWHLLKWVSKVGVGFRLQNEDSRIYSNRRSSRSHLLTRHMSHDFPLPMDECIPELDTLEPLPNTSSVHRGQSRAFVKRHSKSVPQKPAIFRTKSLQPVSFNSDGNEINRAPAPLMRMMSSPDGSQTRRLSSTRSDTCKPSSSFSNKMRSRSGTVVSASSVRRRGTGDSFFRRLMSFSSRRRSSLATSVAVNPEPERIPMQRHISTVSSFSEDMDEEMDEETLLNSGSVDDERQYGRVPKRLFFYYLRACSWIVSCVFVLSAFSWQAVRVSTDHWLSKWSEAGKQNDSGPGDSKSGAIGDSYFQMYAFLSVISVLTALASNALGQYAGSRGRANLHRQLLDSILNAPLRIVEATPTGRILSRFSGDMGVIDKKISTSFQRLLQFVLLCGSAIVVNAILTPKTLLLALPIVLVYIYVQRFFCASSRELQRLDGLSKAPIISHFNETLNGLWTIRAAGRQKIVSLQMEHLLDSNATAAIMANAASRWLGVALDYLGGVIVLVSTLAALLACQQSDKVTPALVGLAINYTLLTPVYLTWVVRLRAEMEMYMSAVERVRYWTTLPTESSSTDANEEQKKSSDEWPVKGELEWKEASISYGITMAPVLQDLNVVIPHGQKVGICGRTGSGKSSLIMSLVRFNEILEGKVLIDGRDVTQIPIKELRSKIAVMPQDIVLFSGKIRWNLDPKEMFTDDQLWAALEKAQLKDYIRTLPGGLDADVVLSGQNFSAGQRQLLGLARASLLNSPILLLDEPSSQLDQETQSLMRKAMQSLFQNRTVLLIAHRMATLMECDRILVLDNGCIVEDGAPAVLKAKNGYFGSLLKVGFRV